MRWLNDTVLGIIEEILNRKESTSHSKNEMERIRQALREFSQMKNRVEPKQEKSIAPQFYEVEMDGAIEERFGSIPKKNESNRERFVKEMKEFELLDGEEAPFVSFPALWPCYAQMNKAQWSWYLYWRTQARFGKYLGTDLNYILIYSYELVNGYGWNRPEEGFNRLKALWLAYREQYPLLNRKMYAWLADFAIEYDVPFNVPEIRSMSIPFEDAARNLLIDLHSREKPLKLPFQLIDAMCDYSLVGNSFYMYGQQQLMEEAIPRVIALADAFWYQKMDKGILRMYGPSRPVKQGHFWYADAIYRERVQSSQVTVKDYIGTVQLRTYINSLVRFAENELRILYNFRGRLRGMEVDAELAQLIRDFLKKEYDPKKKLAEMPKEELKLDFDSIALLREQSNAVRDALEVTEEEEPVQVPEVVEEKVIPKPTGEVQPFVEALSEEQRAVIAVILKGENVQDELETLAEAAMSLPEILIDEINELATQFLDDIVIDTMGDVPCILEQYITQLTQIGGF